MSEKSMRMKSRQILRTARTRLNHEQVECNVRELQQIADKKQAARDAKKMAARRRQENHRA